MPEFLNPTDIGNRAAQHCGAEMMDPIQGFNEVSKTARNISFVYGKLRRAELEQNVWTFATRKAALRPVDTNTLLLAPALWVSTTTYFVGSVVADSVGTLWISDIPSNLNNQPGLAFSAWEPYFGPLTAALYDSSQAYFAGELVYTAAGDGTYNTYLSLLTGNAVHPGLPNQWSVSTTYFQNDVVQSFPAWASGTTYAAGATVTYTDGNTYSSLIAGNVGNAPTANIGTKWALTPTLTLASQTVPMTTPLTNLATSPVNEWARATTYGLGSFVMFNGSEYVSIVANNTGNLPNASGSTFWKVLSGGTLYMSLIDLNGGNNPTSAPAAWSNLTTYSSGQQVYSPFTGLIYTSATNSNLGNDPSTDSGTNWTNTNVLCPWTSVFTQGGGNSQWMQVGGASFPTGVGLSELNIVYPAGSGPLSQSWTKNVFHIPAGFLREAPQSPKAGSSSALGAPGGLIYNDWEFENQYIVSMTSTPILFRFVADIQDVTRMKSLFCEGLAASIGLAVCEPLTNSTAKLAGISRIYKDKISQAKLQNAIEAGAEEPPVDDMIACRI